MSICEHPFTYPTGMYSLFLSVSLFMTGMYIPSDWKDKSPRGSTASLPQPFLPFPPSLLPPLPSVPILQLPLPSLHCPSTTLFPFLRSPPPLLPTFPLPGLPFLLLFAYSPTSFLLYPFHTSSNGKSRTE